MTAGRGRLRLGGRPGAHRVGPILIGLGAMAAAGAVVIGLAWAKAAGTDVVPFQVPALVAALVGLALAGLALAAYDVHLGRRDDALERRGWAEVVDQFTDLARLPMASGDRGD